MLFRSVTVEYQHLDASYFHHALGLSVRNFEGRVLTSASGVLSSAYRDTNLSNDIDATQSTLSLAFHGTLVRRTDSTFDGSRLTKEEVWSEATDGTKPKYTTDHTFDDSGRRLTSKNPAGTITRSSYDVLNREIGRASCRERV